MQKTLYPNRTKLSAFLLPCLLGVWLGWGVSWFLTIASAAAVVVFAISLLPGAAWLKLDEQGFTIRSLYRHTSTRWADVGTILVVTQRQLGLPVRRMVGWTYVQSYPRSIVLKASRGLVDFEALLPDTYGMKAADLAALMDEWRKRAGAHRPAA